MTKNNTQHTIDINSEVDTVDPANYGIKGRKAIVPRNYYITSGDAIQKATALIRDVETELDDPGIRPSHPYKAALRRVLGQCKKLYDKLVEIRGDAVFLETEWNDHVLYVLAKNPRKKI